MAIEVTWRQPFCWGLLLAFDDERDWVPPENVGTDDISATSSCCAVPSGTHTCCCTR